MNNEQLEALLNQTLSANIIKDYCPNGLQVEGRAEVKNIITGVTASQALIDQAIEQKADAILVHHGYFWKGEPEPIKGMKGKRIRALIQNDINLYAYHLPVDVHPELGNNAQLAKLLDIEVLGSLDASPAGVVMFGQLEKPLSAQQFSEKIEQALTRKPLHIESSIQQPIQTIAWCTGGGQDYIELAAQAYVERADSQVTKIDAFISGEISERTTYTARELGIHYFSAGHHATERYGIKALGEWLAKNHALDVEFIDIDNPV